MKLSKVLIACALLAGGLAPVAAIKSLNKETKIVQADTTKDLSTIISTGNRSFDLKYIDNFFFDFSLSEQIFTRTGYMNDHISEFLDENNQPINLGDGIVINGQTLSYWINFQPDPVSYPRNDGTVAFPLYAGNKFNPVAIEVQANKIAFKVNLEYFPMDSIIVTFKAGIFKGYYNGTKFTLSEDLTFYSTLVDTYGGDISRITFVRERQETIINAKITEFHDWGDKTNSQGGTYHQYVFFTNIPRNASIISDTFPATHWRNVYDNYLLDGKSFTEYNAWARGNSKDFTDLSDKTTITRDYETMKPGGAVSVNECMAIIIQNPTDQPNYTTIVSMANQLVIDLNIQNIEFTLRDGSVWYTYDENNNPIKGRINQAAFNNMVLAATQELEEYVDLSTFSEETQLTVSEIISAAQADMWNAFTQIGINAVVTQAKAQIDAALDAEQININRVIALIDAIPAEITYTEACGSAIRAAMEAFANLTAAEVARFPSEKIDKLYVAYEAFSALDLANFKTLSKAEIRAKANPNDYRTTEKAAILDLIELADGMIDAATTKEAVQQVVDAFLLSIANIPTNKQLTAQEVAAAKTEAKAQLDAIDLDAYRAEEKAKVVELINNGKVAIDQCESVEEVNTLLNKILAVIASIKTDAELTQASVASKQAQQRTTAVVIIVVSSLTLIIGMGLTIFFIRRRKSHQ